MGAEDEGAGVKAEGLAAVEVQAGRRRARRELSTSTLTRDGRIVPWLAAEGPLAYTPEAPPERDYYFQYSWILPSLFSDRINRRNHYYFGTRDREDAGELFDFWNAARAGRADRVAVHLGLVGEAGVVAPVAVYRFTSWRQRPSYVLMQHGSYQLVPTAEQPLLERGELLVHRGVHEAAVFRFPHIGETARDAAKSTPWARYVASQAAMLSDSALSFRSIHDRAVRCETGHIRDRSCEADQVARAQGLDIDGCATAKELWAAATQSFTLARWCAEMKFGPNFVTFRTPVGNVRLTTFFAGEHEVRIIDPDRLELVEAVGCSVERTRERPASAHGTS